MKLISWTTQSPLTLHHCTNEIKNKCTWISLKIFVFYRMWKVKNTVVLDVRSAAHLEAFWIKQGMLFLHVSNVLGMCRAHACAVTCLICWSLTCRDSFQKLFFFDIKNNIQPNKPCMNFFWNLIYKCATGTSILCFKSNTLFFLLCALFFKEYLNLQVRIKEG